MAQFSIRPMSETDVPAVYQVERMIYDFPWTERNFLDSLLAGYSAHCMWIDQGLAGYLVTMTVLDETHLLNISIRADLQGQGLGRQLLQWALSQSRMSGLQGMLLEVRLSNNAARHLYETEGFKLIGTRKNYYPAHSGREDALVMFKRFQQMV